MPRILPLLGLLLAGCAAQPAAVSSVPLLKAGADPLPVPGPPGIWPEGKWWQRYGDPQLDRLMDEALADSPSIAAAAARLRKAEAIARQAAAALAPSLSADASLTGNQQSLNNGPPPFIVPKGIHSNTRLAGSANWDPDLWGRNRDALAAARGEAVATAADAAEVRRVLTSAVASAYVDLARTSRDRDNALEVASLRRRSFELNAARSQQGLDTSATAQQSLATDRGAQSDLVAIDEQIALGRARLAALLGKAPDRGGTIAPPTITPAAQQFLPLGIGVDIVARRPDIAASLARIDAASRRVRAARKDFLPNLSLSGLAGLQSLDLETVTKSGSEIYSFGLAIHLPLFDGGRLRAALGAQRADYDLAVATYNQSLVGALQDVAGAVVSARTLDQRIAQLGEARAAAERAAAVARARHEEGLTSAITVLAAEDTLIATRRALLAVQFRRLSADIDLIRALGGGYGDAAPARVPSP